MKLPRTARLRCIQRRSSALLPAEHPASGQPRVPVQIRARRVARWRVRQSATVQLPHTLPAAVFTTKLEFLRRERRPLGPPFYCGCPGGVPPAPRLECYLRKLTDVMIFSHTACNSCDVPWSELQLTGTTLLQ